MCAWPGMPALRAPCEAQEGASPLTGNGPETERLEGGGEEELGNWQTGPVRPGWDTLHPGDPGWKMGSHLLQRRERGGASATVATP